MSPLPALRAELDVFPSPRPGEPGLVLRDPLRYGEHILLVPPALVHAIPLFDGKHEAESLTACLSSLGLPLARAKREAEALRSHLSSAGFLHDERFEELRERAHRAFREAELRPPAHSGSGYPDHREPLASTLDTYHASAPVRSSARAPAAPWAIIAPHVSPFGGASSYAAAYAGITPELAEHTFVVLGTSHHGAPERFGLTTKPFLTPFGQTRANPSLVQGLARSAPSAVLSEDYQHATEHSIEFQVVFLQHATKRADIEVVPVLVGPFLESLYSGQPPERDDGVRAFLDALRELESKRDRLVFVLGVDLSHVGRRYGDDFRAQSRSGVMLEIEVEDRARLEALLSPEPERFLERVTKDQDPLRWCGFSPLYTFTRAFPEARGHLLHYDQWNIDDASVVSFVAAEYPKASV